MIFFFFLEFVKMFLKVRGCCSDLLMGSSGKKRKVFVELGAGIEMKSFNRDGQVYLGIAFQ